ncbi:MAG TPA: MAPEG family protein [Terriglobales bacterium]|nr:MAPEG family protein [Terriglobales bacterium]
MTTDLWMLVLSAVLALSMPAIYLIGEMQVPGGMEWGLGNRDTHLELPPWAARAKRAHYNLIENLVPFTILVLAAHVGGQANSLTAIGATVFFLSRVAYAVIYTAGITLLRTIVFFLGTAAQLLILLQLF